MEPSFLGAGPAWKQLPIRVRLGQHHDLPPVRVRGRTPVVHGQLFPSVHRLFLPWRQWRQRPRPVGHYTSAKSRYPCAEVGQCGLQCHCLQLGVRMVRSASNLGQLSETIRVSSLCIWPKRDGVQDAPAAQRTPDLFHLRLNLGCAFTRASITQQHPDVHSIWARYTRIPEPDERGDELRSEAGFRAVPDGPKLLLDVGVHGHLPQLELGLFVEDNHGALERGHANQRAEGARHRIEHRPAPRQGLSGGAEDVVLPHALGVVHKEDHMEAHIVLGSGDLCGVHNGVMILILRMRWNVRLLRVPLNVDRGLPLLPQPLRRSRRRRRWRNGSSLLPRRPLWRDREVRPQGGHLLPWGGAGLAPLLRPGLPHPGLRREAGSPGHRGLGGGRFVHCGT
mmetsp:Transcript_102365/g.285217  ORF Transcript_102365/g.285217 Transcript_102365/m.285217 type:complete len:394 (+) Transcript_102365:1010-2191(+)